MVKRNEVFRFVKGRRFWRLWIGYLDTVEIEGTPSEVAFNGDHFCKNYKRYIGLYHTHPYSEAFPSLTDRRTFTGMVIATGKKLLCAIKGVDGLRFYWFNPIDDKPWVRGIEVSVHRIGKFFFGVIPK